MFVLCITSTFFMPISTFASMGEQNVLNVDAAWIEGEMLKIDMTNVNTGKKQKLELHLEDYTNSSEYISIQAIDTVGNKSNVVQVKNPYYKPEETTKAEEITETTTVEAATKKSDKVTETGIPNNKKSAFTPAGNGEVMDNANENDGKEFFTIKTKDGNVFYLIIDRQRGSENVYLLNSVSESDLMALAEKDGTSAISAIPEQTVEKTEQTETEAEEIQSKSDTNSSIGTIVLIIVIIAIVGGVGYYFKIYKPKHSDNYTDNDEDSENEDDYEKDFYNDNYNEYLSDDYNASEKENFEE